MIVKGSKNHEDDERSVLGIVENMSYFVCPDCGKKHFCLEQAISKKLDRARHLSNRLPAVRSKMAALCDEGKMGRSPRRTPRKEATLYKLTKPLHLVNGRASLGKSQTIGLHTRDFFAITLAKESLFYYNDVYKVQAVYKRKACTIF